MKYNVKEDQSLSTKHERKTLQNCRDTKRTRRTQKGQRGKKGPSIITKQSMINKVTIHFPKPYNVRSSYMYKLKQFAYFQLSRLRDTYQGQVPGLANESRATYVNNRAKALGPTDSKYAKIFRKSLPKNIWARFEIYKFFSACVLFKSAKFFCSYLQIETRLRSQTKQGIYFHHP